MLTFWKTDSIPPADCLVTYVIPLGAATKVHRKMLQIPKMINALPDLDGVYFNYLWEVNNGVYLRIRDEPEFGRGGVFSIQVEGQNRVPKKDFKILYLHMSELFGVVLLNEGHGFLIPRQMT